MRSDFVLCCKQSPKFVLQVEKKGVIYFEDVCKLILRKFREDDESEFIKIMFKVGRCVAP